MSVESAKQFIQRFSSDPELKKRLAAATGADEKMAIIRAEGYDFTPEEIDQIDEIPEETLDMIAGGCSYCDMDL